MQLGDFFSEEGIRVMREYGIDMVRLSQFIEATLEVGGTVSEITLATPAWIREFQHDEDATFLIEGAAYGFTWEASDPEEFYEVPNYVRPEHEAKVDQRISEELEAGQYVPTTRDKVRGIAAMGVVDKQRSGFTKYRVVHDLSRPHGGSVNDGMEVAKRRFVRFQQACDLLRPHTYLVKIDLTNAYRSVPMAPEWWPRHAFQWREQVYMDLRMPFGNKGAPAAFDRITQAVVRNWKAAGYTTLGYLDDFLVLIPRINQGE